MTRRVGPSKYAPLTGYLAAYAGDVVRLTLPEIEAIIGAPLPVSARHSAFWVNRSRPPSWFAGRSWVQVGWRVLRTELHARPPAVCFARVAPDSTG
jgi:hypothetical protein